MVTIIIINAIFLKDYKIQNKEITREKLNTFQHNFILISLFNLDLLLWLLISMA